MTNERSAAPVHRNPVRAGGGIPAVQYTLTTARDSGGIGSMWRAARSKNACKTCALGMGGQSGGMVNEAGHFPEICKKSLQAMASDMQPKIPESFWRSTPIDVLRKMSPRELESQGRLTQPMILNQDSPHYRPISWNDALETVADQLASIEPDETFWYLSGRSSNEAAFLAQLFARLYGTNNVNNCSYYCHQASGVGLGNVLGTGTATVSLDDVENADLFFLIGGNPASNHPRLLNTLKRIRRKGGEVVVINPIVERGLVRFRIPSDPRSMISGTRIASRYIQPHIGGDLALLSGIAKRVVELGAHDASFLESNCDGTEAFLAHLVGLPWAEIEAKSGVDRQEIDSIARIYAGAKSVVFGWTMGITHHAHGVENVEAIANLALLRGMVGRPSAGLLPIRGHSNIQGVGSMGVTPQLKQAAFDAIESQLDVQLPTSPGWDTMACMEAAHSGSARLGIFLGGNLYGSNPDADFASDALGRLDLTVHLNTTLNTGHAHGTGRQSLILPVLPRDEEPQPTTQESMFNFVRLSSGGPTRHVGPRSEVQLIADLADRTLNHRSDDSDVPRTQLRVDDIANSPASDDSLEPQDSHRPSYLNRDGESAGFSTSPPTNSPQYDSPAGLATINWATLRDTGNVRGLIADIVPGYGELQESADSEREFTVSGRVFHEPRFPTPNGRAQLQTPQLPDLVGETRELGSSKSSADRPPPTQVWGDEDGPRPAEAQDAKHVFGQTDEAPDILQAQPPAQSQTPSQAHIAAPVDTLRLMTIRSEGQFNTVVYEEHDLYRGIGRRDVILIHPRDLKTRGLADKSRVVVRSETGRMTVFAAAFEDIRPGNVAMYFPEANKLVPRATDPRSKTPAFKAVAVTVDRHNQ